MRVFYTVQKDDVIEPIQRRKQQAIGLNVAAFKGSLSRQPPRNKALELLKSSFLETIYEILTLRKIDYKLYRP